MTYAEIFNKIVNARKLETLRKAVDFYESVVLDVKGEEDVFIGVLEDMLAEKKDSPIHQMLLDYIKETNDEDELIDALFEFNLAIDLFKTVRKEVVFQIKADDFNLALNKAEEIFELKSILESRYKIEVIETKAMPFVDYESVVTRKKQNVHLAADG